jgi:hypothetical protein
MDLLAKERDRVLQRAARAYGLGFTIASALCFVLPGAVDESTRTNYVRLWARVRDELQLLLAAAGGSPELAAESSRELLALLDGLALGIAAEQQHPDVARRIAHRRVDELIRTPN